MPEIPTWLDRLERATDYRELQEIFSEIAAQAQAGDEHGELARHVDEAVRRLEAERARDEQELQEIQSRYETFREENKGVVGWFKRHIPFTETRRQEGGYKGDVAQQVAEILADNLVIARAQMLKERFLGPAERKLGQRPNDWQVRLEDAAADRELVPLGQALQDLAGEVERSEAFLHALQHDLNAFVGAAFKAAEDRQQRDADLTAARQEKAELAREVDAEVALKQAGLKQLAARAVSELDRTDAAFHADGRQVGKLREVLTRADEARTSLGNLIAAAASLGKLMEELKGVPGQMQEARQSLTRLENQRLESSADCTNKGTIFDERRRQFEAAQRDAEQTRQLLASAQQFYDAWLAESRGNSSQPLPAEAPTESPMWHRFNEAKAVAEAAQARLAKAGPPFEQARKEAEAAQAALQEMTKQRDSRRDKVQALERRAPELKLEVIGVIDRIQVTFAAAATGLATYLGSERGASATAYPSQALGAGNFGWLGSHGLERPLADALVQAERDYQRHLQAVQLLNRTIRWLDDQRKAADQEQAAVRERRDAAWKRRCRELLGDQMANAACASGLPG
jgi:hypothetical protein